MCRKCQFEDFAVNEQFLTYSTSYKYFPSIIHSKIIQILGGKK